MYDRKTWVIVALCGGLIATNLYFQTKAKQEAAERQKWEEAATKATTPAPADPVANSGPPALAVDTPPPSTEEQLVTLENDKISFIFTNVGGGVKFAELKDQFDVGSTTSLVKMNRFGSGAIGAIAGADHSLDQSIYSYREEDSIPGKRVVYIKQLASGLVAKKTFSLVEDQKPGAPYLLNFELTLENTTTAPLNLSQWSLFLGEATPLYQSEAAPQTGFFWRTNDSMHFKDGTKFKGGMFSSAKEIITSDAGDTLDYAGVTNQFFTTVIRPSTPTVSMVWGMHSDEKLTATATAVSSVRAGLTLPAVTLSPKEQKTFGYRIFMGPKHNDMLRKMDSAWGKGWGDLMQYGDWLQVAARPLNYLLNLYHGWLDGVAKKWSWGLAIILLTLTVRTAIWPLHAKSTHTMKRMSKLQPEIAKLKEKYPDDPNKMNQEMMGLYKKYGINPLGGCLPMLIQIPIFFGFFKMLQYAVELRHQGFLWIPDLSQPHTIYTIHLPFSLPLIGAALPINILPILMAITNYAQMAMMPKTGDKTQQQIMKFMPLMFFFFCYNYASALALYWTTQNIFSIGQTWLMNKIPEPELKARADNGKKSWVQRMAERQAEIQKNGRPTPGMKDVTPDAKKKRTPRTGG